MQLNDPIILQDENNGRSTLLAKTQVSKLRNPFVLKKKYK